jgi:hypothetical protein
VDLFGQGAHLFGQGVDLLGQIGVLLQQVDLRLSELVSMLRRRLLVRLVRPRLSLLGDDDQRASVESHC